MTSQGSESPPKTSSGTGDTVSRNLATAIDRNEAAAYTDLVHSLPSKTAADFGAGTERFESATALVVPGTQSAFFNRVIGLGVSEPTTEGTIKDIVRLYRELETPFMVHVGPVTRPTDIVTWLTDQGLVRDSEWITLYRGTQPVDSYRTDFVARRIDLSDAALFAQTFCVGYGLPDEWAPLFESIVGRDHWRHYVLFDDEIPIGTGSLFINGKFGWLGNGATRSSHRRRGAHATLASLRVQEGIRLGCQLLTGETWQESPGRPNPSLRNHIRNGFRRAYVRTNFVSR